MEKKKGINRHAAGLCAGLGILFAAVVPMTAFADTVYVNASKLNYRKPAVHCIRSGSRNTASRDRALQNEK